MAMLLRKRNRRVRLANRMGSRRTRILLALAFALIAVASFLMSSDPASETKSYLVALTDIAPDSQLNEQTVEIVNLDLNDQENRYLLAESKKSNWVISKPIRAGELIPVSALVDPDEANCIFVKVGLGVELSGSIHRGDLIDLWAGEANSAVESGPVQIVAAGLLREIFTATDSLGQSSQEVEVCVSPAEIRSVVNSIAKQDVIIGVRSL